MNTECTLPTALSEHADNAESLSQMIQTSAKSKGALVRFCPVTDNPVVMVHFHSLNAATRFHGAFSLFSAAAKRTVKRVRAKERAEMTMKSPGKIIP